LRWDSYLGILQKLKKSLGFFIKLQKKSPSVHEGLFLKLFSLFSR
jgi:hypothetical protein